MLNDIFNGAHGLLLGDVYYNYTSYVSGSTSSVQETHRVYTGDVLNIYSTDGGRPCKGSVTPLI